eukprot:1157715-Pelagomonas_calceolata.AAC.8
MEQVQKRNVILQATSERTCTLHACGRWWVCRVFPLLSLLFPSRRTAERPIPTRISSPSTACLHSLLPGQVQPDHAHLYPGGVSKHGVLTVLVANATYLATQSLSLH